MQMDSIAFFTIETGGQKGHVIWILTNQQAAWGDVMPSSSMVKCTMKSIYNVETLLPMTDRLRGCDIGQR